VIDENFRKEKLFSQILRPKLRDSIMEKKNCAFTFFGPSEENKKVKQMMVYNGSKDKGILYKALEEMITLFNDYQFQVSAY